MISTSGNLTFTKSILDGIAGVGISDTHSIYTCKGWITARVQQGLFSPNGGASAVPLPSVDYTYSGTFIFTSSDLFTEDTTTWLSTIRLLTGNLTKEAGSLRMVFPDQEMTSPYTHVVTNNFVGSTHTIDITKVDYMGSFFGSGLTDFSSSVDAFDGIYEYIGGQSITITMGIGVIGVFKTGY